MYHSLFATDVNFMSDIFTKSTTVFKYVLCMIYDSNGLKTQLNE